MLNFCLKSQLKNLLSGVAKDEAAIKAAFSEIKQIMATIINMVKTLNISHKLGRAEETKILCV